MIRIARGPVRWWLRMTGYAGITLPPFGMFIVREHINNERLIRHEQAHWRQAQQLGIVKFYVKYLWLSLRHGYRDNPMEVEARAAEYPVKTSAS